MTLPFWNMSALAFGIAGGALSAIGCSLPETAAESPATTDMSADQAVSAVHDCQQQARSCAKDAAANTCEADLRACLSNAGTTGDGGARHERGEGGRSIEDDEAGNPSPRPPRDDAEAPDPKDLSDAEVKSHDGGAPHVPSVVADGGSPVLACIHDLRACLATARKPFQCAEEAVACLTQRH